MSICNLNNSNKVTETVQEKLQQYICLGLGPVSIASFSAAFILAEL